MVNQRKHRIKFYNYIITHYMGKVNRQHRIIIVVRLRRQIFRQIVQIERRRADAHQAKFVQDDGKYASKALDDVNVV